MDNTVKMTTLVKTDNKIPPDKSKFGVLDIVLRGGSPWGFALQGGRETRSPLTVSKVGAFMCSIVRKCLFTVFNIG